MPDALLPGTETLVIKPLARRLIGNILGRSVVIVVGGGMAWLGNNGALLIMGGLLALWGAVLVASCLYSVLTHGFDLRTGSDGISIGRHHYRWAEIGPGFYVRFEGTQNTGEVRFGLAGFRGLANYYGIPPEALVALLNGRMYAALGITPPPPVQPPLPGIPRDLPDRI
jgi:hypothetical protein